MEDLTAVSGYVVPVARCASEMAAAVAPAGSSGPSALALTLSAHTRSGASYLSVFDRLSAEEETMASELDLLRSGSASDDSKRPQRDIYITPAQSKALLREAFELFEAGGVDAVCAACERIAAVVDHRHFSDVDVLQAYDLVLEALSKHADSVEVCAPACTALAKMRARGCGSSAAVNRALLAVLQQHQSSASLRETVVEAFFALVHTPDYPLSEICDQSGSEAIVLSLSVESALDVAMVSCVLPMQLLKHADDSLLKAGIVDALVGFVRRFKGSRLEALGFDALYRCVQKWRSAAKALAQTGIFDLILECADAQPINLGTQQSAWRLFFAVSEYSEPTDEQQSRAVLRAAKNVRGITTGNGAFEFVVLNAQVLKHSCSGSPERRLLAVRLDAVPGILSQLRRWSDGGTSLTFLLDALKELMYCSKARSQPSGASIIGIVIEVLSKRPFNTELQDAGMVVVEALTRELWFEEVVANQCSRDRSGLAIVAVFLNYLHRKHSSEECAEAAYKMLLPAVDATSDKLKGDEEWSRLQVYALQVLNEALRAQRDAERRSEQLICPALLLVGLVSPSSAERRLAAEEFPRTTVLVAIQSLRSAYAPLQSAACSALNVLFDACPDSELREVVFLLRENSTADVLASIICDESVKEQLLFDAAYLLVAVVIKIKLAYALEDPRPVISDKLVPAVLRLLRTPEASRTAACQLLHLLFEYSQEYGSQLVAPDVIKALIKPLLSPNPLRAADATYAALRLLVEADAACATQALDAGLLKVKASKSACADRVALEDLLRERRDADNEGAAASADAAAAELLAEEEAEAAAKSAAQQKRKAKKKPAARAAAAASAAPDAPLPAEPAPDAEADADGAAAGSQDGDSGAAEAPSQKPRKKTSRGGRGKGSRAKPGGSDDEKEEAHQPAAEASAEELSSAIADMQLEEEAGFTAVETRKKGGRKQPAASPASPPAPAPPPAPKPQPQPRTVALPQPRPQSQSPTRLAAQPRPQPQSPTRPAARPQPRAVAQPQPPPAPPVRPEPPLAAMPQMLPVLPVPPFIPPPAAHAMPVLPWQMPQPARAEPIAVPQFSLFAQPPAISAVPESPRAPQPYRPPPAAATQHPASLLPPSIFSSLAEGPVARAAPTSQPDASAQGLSNAAGEYNCFLNSIVQALYHVLAFRKHMLRSHLPDHVSNLAVQRSIALVRALGDLFEALQRGAALRRHVEPGAASGEASGAVAPTSLRQALAALNAGGAGEGAMNAMADAAEVLSALYDAFQSVSAAAKTRRAPEETPIARMFGFGVHEAAHCNAAACRRKVTHELRFRSFFHIVFSTALREASATAAAQGLRMSFEELLSQLQGGDVKRCDKDVGGCGAAACVRHDLEAPPEVFTISLAWDTAQAAEDVVAATMKVRSVRGSSCAPADASHRRCGLSCGLRWCSTTGRATRRATSCAPWCATTAATTPPTRALTRGPAPRCCLPRALPAAL